MDKFYYLRQPLLYVDVLVLSGFAALFCLTAIWVGGSSRHWFLRAGSIVVLLLALLPVKAHQPAIMFAIALPVLSALVWWMNRRRRSSPTPMRFGMRDLFLTVVLAAVVCVGLTVLIEMRTELDWEKALVDAASICVIAAICYAVVNGVRGRRFWIAALVVAVPGAALATWGSGWRTDLLEMLLFQHLFPDVSSDMDFSIYIESVISVLLAGVSFSLVLTFVLMLTRFAREKRASQIEGSRGRGLRLARGFFVGLVLVSVASVTTLYWQMLQDPPIARDDPREPNSFSRLFKIAQHVQELNPSLLALADMRSDPEKQPLVQPLESAYEDAMRVASEPGHVTRLPVGNRDALRILAEAMAAEAESRGRSGRADEAAAYCLAILELGRISGHRGGRADTNIGSWYEEIGCAPLVRIRHKLSQGSIPGLVARLQAIDAGREGAADVAAREVAWQRAAGAWKARFAQAIMQWLGERPEHGEEQEISEVMNRRDAILRMFIADLAIRSFKNEHGRLPADLQELVPQFMAAVPIDPFSGSPLIYRPQDEGFLLYSVGQDGRDDGGRLGTRRQALSEAGFDWALDSADK